LIQSYQSDKGTHQDWIPGKLQGVLSGLGRKTLPFVHEGYFGDFTRLGKLSNLGIGIIDRGFNFKFWVSIGLNDQMKASKLTKPNFGQKTPNFKN
jgi:hypothetical protein